MKQCNKKSTFDNNERGAIVINTTNVTTEFEIDSNTISNGQYGVWLFNTGGVKDIQIRYNTIFDNTVAGIYNEQADGVLYSQNSIYNNTMGIDNVANNGNDGLENADNETPFISSSVDAGVKL
ncbi:MAG: right-handed parallel beta-helix repeat-containing protein [Chitinophagales bacterium]